MIAWAPGVEGLRRPSSPQLVAINPPAIAFFPWLEGCFFKGNLLAGLMMSGWGRVLTNTGSCRVMDTIMPQACPLHFASVFSHLGPIFQWWFAGSSLALAAKKRKYRRRVIPGMCKSSGSWTCLLINWAKAVEGLLPGFSVCPDMLSRRLRPFGSKF